MESHDFLMFQEVVLRIPDLPPFTAFYTDCAGGATMFTGPCPRPISLYNVLGQVINRYDQSTGWFERSVRYDEVSMVYSAAANSDL